jgi:hypothetical protein
VAEVCGTSVAQIERSYYHINDDTCVSHANGGCEIDEDGTVVLGGSAEDAED